MKVYEMKSGLRDVCGICMRQLKMYCPCGDCSLELEDQYFLDKIALIGTGVTCGFMGETYKEHNRICIL